MIEKPIDVDATWDDTGSLDEHRQREFAKLNQPGFGSQAKDTKAPPIPTVTPEPAIGVDADGE